MRQHVHAGTPRLWHSQGLSSSGPTNPTVEFDCWGSEDSDGVFHWACIQISIACVVGQHNSQVTPPNKESASGLGDRPAINTKKKICIRCLLVFTGHVLDLNKAHNVSWQVGWTDRKTRGLYSNFHGPNFECRTPKNSF